MEITYMIKEGFVKRSIAGETLLIPVGKTTKEFNGMVTLNESGEYLWELLKKPQTEAALLTAMREEFDAPEDILAADVREFLEKGIREGLIHLP